MKIEVTQSDIDAGEAAHCVKCPIAIAASRAYGKPVHVYWDFFYVDSTPTLRVRVPVEACEFIAAFDAGRPVEPFSFEV